ncbi:MAG: hypothetical protein M3Y87_34580 [Myxococcota bacterium]|nr:hypothetical protein [Myxococcota bacterium]
MHSSRALPLALSSVLALTIASACGADEDATPAVDTTPIVGLMELPIAHRNDGNVSGDALRIEISPSELRLDSQPIYTLERGRVPESEVSADGLTDLTAAIRAAPARSRATITAHSLVGYGTAVRAVQSLLDAGYREIAFAVRPLSPTGAAPTQASWLSMSSPQIAEAGRGVIDPATYGGGVRPWSDFVSHWEEAYEACRAGSYVDCDPVPLAPAEGGFLQVVLWARGSGMQLRFNRAGAPPPEPTQPTAPALIEGVRGEAAGAGEEVPPDPSVTGAFAFRATVATDPESPLTAVARPICGAAACQTVIEADEETPMMRVLSFIGAVFPNGATAPQLVFRLPR